MDLRNQPYDLFIASVAMVLVTAGLVMVFSASSPISLRIYGDPTHFAIRNMIYAAIGMALMVTLARMPLETIRKLGRVGFWVCLLMLVLVLIPGVGRAGGGAQRWLDLGVINIQPSEPFKVALVLYVAHLLTADPERVNRIKGGLLPLVGLFSLAATMLMAEPDFGATLTVGAVMLGMIFVAGIRIGWILTLLATTLPAAAIGVMMAPYRLKRVMSFLDPWDDPLGTDFQLVQSLLAFGNGGLMGTGLGEGQQKQFYLPEAHTDFIFAVIGEELGLFAVILIIALFATLVWRAFRIARMSEIRFVSLSAAGLGMLIGSQSLANMGVVMGLLPPKGLTLPMVSYGGSSMIITLGAVGLLLAFSRTLPNDPNRVTAAV
ncbi:cell division-specific peptidoglycan biosynthesis regulator FtsW [Magnetococcus marinus MC-1]|uniref:Probable peptidoglycan glycosyltransferase FtsW n=1 Tax=Magnetococcus marinus (strain ATCC BAA-1437 / JCM 17883 / MC-1) TaxID=156889 RepID=A0L5N2_MAGMM|nr:putative lipid II flippase FtsW [Magnetococcus marinus]ABK43275.1 cell division-specific peptidoglycan biosynthesis regulator FtsW [Magnetococcus marinus MC-1]